MRRALPAFAVAFALLAVWPPLAQPFHGPKLWGFALAAGAGALLTLPRWRWTALPLVALTAVQPWRSPEAGAQALAFAWAVAAWPSLQPELRRFTRVVGVAAALAGAVVVLQALGFDVFSALGPEGISGRLRLYGTLGNPDFVASMLLPVAVLLLGEARWWRAPLLVVVPALVLVGSFATVLSALAAAAVIAARRRAVVVPVLAGVGLLVVGLGGRDLGVTAAGRAYLVQVAAPHVVEAPVLGLGLGATVEAWPAWELAWWQARCAEASCVEAHPSGRFVGRQDHLHADWLEWMLERGLLGVLALSLVIGDSLRASWRAPGKELVVASLAAALARSFVDFSFERPADLCLVAALIALAHSPLPDPLPREGRGR